MFAPLDPFLLSLTCSALRRFPRCLQVRGVRVRVVGGISRTGWDPTNPCKVVRHLVRGPILQRYVPLNEAPAFQ